jgi:hypothetical protein
LWRRYDAPLSENVPGATAEEEKSDREKLDQVCEQIHTLAGQIMRNRQVGVSMPKMIGTVKGDQFEGLFRLIIRDAYGRPRFRGDEYQQRSIEEFQTEWYGTCLDELGRHLEDN